MLSVICVLRSGGVYTPEWVWRLRAGVARHLHLPHEFYCLSDCEVPCERIPLDHDWPEWWAKIEAFRIPGPVLYLDLDTAVVGDLTEIARSAPSGELAMLRDFYVPSRHGSGVMAWGDDVRFLYNYFAEDPKHHMNMRRLGAGDQGYIEMTCTAARIKCFQDLVPDQIVSYKIHCNPHWQAGAVAVLPSNARLVCFHGPPKFESLAPNDPVRMAWEFER